jgi:DNA-binding NtrC family response regulator
MRVIIADDQGEVRAALRLLLGEMGAHQIDEVATAADLWRQIQVARPQLVLADWRIGKAAGPGWLPELRRLEWGTVIIILGLQPEAGNYAARIKADGFISKADSPERVRQVLQAAWQQSDGDEEVRSSP